MIFSPKKRWPWTLFCVGLIFFLASIIYFYSPPAPRVGDGGEYFLMTIAIAEKLQPYGDPTVDRVYDEYCSTKDGSFPTSREINNAFSALSINQQQDYPHFWFYSLLSAPFYLFLNFFGADIAHSYSLLHLCFFGVLLIVAEREYGRRGIVLASMICLASPMLWFIDKAHTEFFTVAVGTIGVIYQLKSKTTFAFLSFCVIATQNPPFGIIAILILTAGMLRSRKLLLPRFWAVPLGFLVLSLHPLYYLIRHGNLTPQLITGAASSTAKGFRELTCFFIDPDVGLISNWPWIVVPLLSVVIIAIWSRQKIAWRTMTFCLVSLAILAWAQTKTNNFNHGGTVKISRYALWYIPFLFPLLLQFSNNYRLVPVWQRVAVYVFLIAAISINSTKFHPARKESFLYQTTIAEKLYEVAPGIYDPVPEIFIERCSRAELPTKAWAITNRSGTKLIVHRGRLRKQQIRLRRGYPLDPVMGGTHLLDSEKLVRYINANVDLPDALVWFYVNSPGDLISHREHNVHEDTAQGKTSEAKLTEEKNTKPKLR